jgi:hypothetical protein
MFLKILFLSFFARTLRMPNSILWDKTLCNPLKVNRHFGGTCHFHLHFRRIRQERHVQQEISVDFQRTTRSYIPENKTLHTHRCENLKYYIYVYPLKPISTVFTS